MDERFSRNELLHIIATNGNCGSMVQGITIPCILQSHICINTEVVLTTKFGVSNSELSYHMLSSIVFYIMCYYLCVAYLAYTPTLSTVSYFGILCTSSARYMMIKQLL